MIAALDRHGVRYVAVGSYPAIVQGVDLEMTDLDIVPATAEDNRVRLVEALKELHANEKRGDQIETIYDLMDDPSSLTDTTFWTFMTDFGELDIVLRPAGFPRGYDELIEHAHSVALRDDTDPSLAVDALVADVHDIYESKRLAGRRKDVDVLPRFAGIHPVDVKESMREKYRADQSRRSSPIPSQIQPSYPPPGAAPTRGRSR
ncbi:MAG: hypothetical protein ACYCV7_07200 [Acidimicrobiales bacterium]|jgi:hypothetical protein